MEHIKAFFTQLVWPVGVTCLPPSVASGKGSPKVDQWRNQIAVLFIALYVAWEVDGEIPDVNALLSASNTKYYTAQATMQRTLHAHLVKLLIHKNPNAMEAELEHAQSATMDHNL
ncbi:hypothetical protein BS17DRAFT_770672 [Gyrodon lividus]|nr:hypothetical protein BS17DRAFT_770672 [Gyrodon lividus]